MRKTIKRICLPVLAMLLVCVMNIPAFASGNLPDPDKTGSISITMKNTDTGEIVSGGSLALYQVADAVEENGDFSFRYVDVFSDCGLPLEDIQSEALASDLASYAERKGLRRTVQTVNTDGMVSFNGMKTGLYLIVQQSAAEGYCDVSPFLVSVPMQSGGEWIYDVDASPKLEVVAKDQTPGTDDGNTSSSGEETQKPGTGASGKTGNKLPQTGQLNWPVPVLAVAGILLYAFGWMLNNTKKKTEYE